MLLKYLGSSILLPLLGLSAGAADSNQPIVFNKDFKWCTATAGHQIEGNNIHSDWWEFEKIPGKIAGGDQSGQASGSFTRVNEDIQLMKLIGANTYRFSVEWSRIEPQEGVFDPSAIHHYADQIQKLSAQNIEPIVTLSHFVLPNWFRKKGGWEASEAPTLFARFVNIVQTQIAQKHVRYFVTINEPLVHIMGGYYLGNVPPAETRAMPDIVPVLVGLLKSHAEAYAILHQNAKAWNHSIWVGTANHLRYFQSKRKLNPADQYVAHVIENAWNWAFPDALETGILNFKIPTLVKVKKQIPGLKGTQDFFGMNYYTRDRIHSGMVLRTARGKPKKSDGDFLKKMYEPANWESYPDGLEKLIHTAHKKYSKLPILITENGVDDETDLKRQAYLANHVKAVGQAIRRGAPVIGYCHWSLLDNFEWIHGFKPRFGLFEVNYSTFERSMRPSGEWFRKMASGQFQF